MPTEAPPRVTGRDVIRVIDAFVVTIDHASPFEVAEVLAYLRGIVAAAGTPAERARAFESIVPPETKPT